MYYYMKWLCKLTLNDLVKVGRSAQWILLSKHLKSYPFMLSLPNWSAFLQGTYSVVWRQRNYHNNNARSLCCYTLGAHYCICSLDPLRQLEFVTLACFKQLIVVWSPLFPTLTLPSTHFSCPWDSCPSFYPAGKFVAQSHEIHPL